MLAFPNEILSSKKALVIAVDENNELIFSTDNLPGYEWTSWELLGAIQFAENTFNGTLPSNAAKGAYESPEPEFAFEEQVPDPIPMEPVQLSLDFGGSSSVGYNQSPKWVAKW